MKPEPAANLSLAEVCFALDLEPGLVRRWQQELPFLPLRPDPQGNPSFNSRDLHILGRLRSLVLVRGLGLAEAARLLIHELSATDLDLLVGLVAARRFLAGNRLRLQASRQRLDQLSALLTSFNDENCRWVSGPHPPILEDEGDAGGNIQDN